MNSSGPGTPAYRFTWLIQELEKRFPGVVDQFSSAGPEGPLLEAIDNLLGRRAIATTLIAEIQSFCREADQYNPERTKHQVLAAAMSELGELAEEVNIDTGKSYKVPGPDGIVGEGVDVINAVVDLIYRHDPTLSEVELTQLARAKCQKWISKLKEHAAKS